MYKSFSKPKAKKQFHIDSGKIFPLQFILAVMNGQELKSYIAEAKCFSRNDMEVPQTNSFVANFLQSLQKLRVGETLPCIIKDKKSFHLLCIGRVGNNALAPTYKAIYSPFGNRSLWNAVKEFTDKLKRNLDGLPGFRFGESITVSPYDREDARPCNADAYFWKDVDIIARSLSDDDFNGRLYQRQLTRVQSLFDPDEIRIEIIAAWMQQLPSKRPIVTVSQEFLNVADFRGHGLRHVFTSENDKPTTSSHDENASSQSEKKVTRNTYCYQTINQSGVINVSHLFARKGGKGKQRKTNRQIYNLIAAKGILTRKQKAELFDDVVQLDKKEFRSKFM